MTTDQQITAGYQRRPLNLARRLIGMHSTGARRAYLAETGSQYAGSDDPSIIDAAFSGHVLNALASLADAYERNLKELATAKSLVAEELADAKAMLASMGLPDGDDSFPQTPGITMSTRSHHDA